MWDSPSLRGLCDGFGSSMWGKHFFLLFIWPIQVCWCWCEKASAYCIGISVGGLGWDLSDWDRIRSLLVGQSFQTVKVSDNKVRLVIL